MNSIAVLIVCAVLMIGGEASANSVEPIAEQETVVLLHGLARTENSMVYMKHRLSGMGYRVVSISYPSRDLPPEELIERVGEELRARGLADKEGIHFVTHSLGGLIVRGLAEHGWAERIGRVVMLGPPNHGSVLADEFGAKPIFEGFLGRTGRSLGTGPDSFPESLGAPEFELGVIAGNRSINPVGSILLPGSDDGFVSVDAARLEGMADFIVLPVNHSTLILNPAAADQVQCFLTSGAFCRQPHKTPTVPNAL